MAKSIMQNNDRECYLCGANGTADPLHWHHVFGGANRKHSEKYGLKVRLCGQKCHENGPDAVHRNAAVSEKLKEEGQRAFESVHGTREDFRRIFGRNYLADTDGMTAQKESGDREER
ncbi:MAG: hypothetical protein K2J60_03575 [Acetatifactor sp.]|nr:hypothetical protein [Acetatifactor sp.]